MTDNALYAIVLLAITLTRIGRIMMTSGAFIRYSLHSLLIGAAGVIGLIPAGCSPAKVASNPPPHHTGAPVVDLSAPPQGFVPVDQVTVGSLCQVTANRPIPPAGRPLNILAISGGGQFGAFAVGVLVGWTARGDRPDFDIVTGISSGAVIAVMAYCGPKYDAEWQQGFTTLRNEDVVSSKRVIRNIRRTTAISCPDPLKRIINEHIDEEFMDDIRAAHLSGRRLYIGTMEMTTRRIVYWDIGALACNLEPCKAHQLVKDLILASGSVPGFSPTVPINVEVNGKCYTEHHGDGGGISQVFLRFGDHHPRPDPANPGLPWLTGSNLYVIAAGKLYPEVLEPKLGVIPRISSTVSGTLFALFNADLWKVYTFCQLSGMKFNLTAVPDEVKISPSSMDFDPDLELSLFTVGYDAMMQRRPWRHTPPGSEPGELNHPRTGLRFLVPNPRCVSGPLPEKKKRGLTGIVH